MNHHQGGRNDFYSFPPPTICSFNGTKPAIKRVQYGLSSCFFTFVMTKRTGLHFVVPVLFQHSEWHLKYYIRKGTGDTNFLVLP